MQSEFSGDTSRFTSWSSSVRRTSSNASNRQPANELLPHMLPVISEGNDQSPARPTPDRQDISTHRLPSRFDEAGTPPRYTVNKDTRHRSKAQAENPTTQQLDNKDVKLLASGIRFKRADPISPGSSSSVSSPSLASSGRGDSPRQGIAPSALCRLRELSLNLQKICKGGDEARESPAKMQASYTLAHHDDPFYDGKKKKDTLFAFQSAPTTPAESSLSNIPNLPPAGKGSKTMSPQYFFRGTSPYRRSLRESMKTFEGATATFRAQSRDRAGGCDGPSGDNIARQTENVQAGGNEDDAPLLRPDGVRQWSRVQA